MTVQHCFCGRILPHARTPECEKPRVRVAEDGTFTRVGPGGQASGFQPEQPGSTPGARSTSNGRGES